MNAIEKKLKSGQTVKVYQKIKEGNKERIQIFEGLIIDVRNRSDINHTIVVRKVVDGIGVEKIFPVQSPFVDKIEITKEAQVRRANLSYMRGRTGKSSRMKNEEHIKVVVKGKKKVEEAAPETENVLQENVENVQQETPSHEEGNNDSAQKQETVVETAPQGEESAEKQAE